MQTEQVDDGNVENVSAAPSPTTWDAYARDLGVRLQKLRIDRDITQEDLAHRAGLTRTHYQQIERGWWKRDQPANPSIKVIVRLAQVLAVAPGEIFPPHRGVEWPRD